MAAKCDRGLFNVIIGPWHRPPANDDERCLEYRCRDCGASVFCAVYIPQACIARRCLVCTFVAQASPTVREDLRARLNRTGLEPSAREPFS